MTWTRESTQWNSVESLCERQRKRRTKLDSECHRGREAIDEVRSGCLCCDNSNKWSCTGCQNVPTWVEWVELANQIPPFGVWIKCVIFSESVRYDFSRDMSGVVNGQKSYLCANARVWFLWVWSPKIYVGTAPNGECHNSWWLAPCGNIDMYGTTWRGLHVFTQHPVLAPSDFSATFLTSRLFVPTLEHPWSLHHS